MPHGVYGLSEHFSRFFCRHASEIPHFDQSGKRLIFLRKRFESTIKVQNLNLLTVGITRKFQFVFALC